MNALDAVTQALREHPRGLTGSELMDTTKLSAATLYPLLAREERAGRIRSWWRTGVPPRNRVYALPETPPKVEG